METDKLVKYLLSLALSVSIDFIMTLNVLRLVPLDLWEFHLKESLNAKLALLDVLLVRPLELVPLVIELQLLLSIFKSLEHLLHAD